MQILPIIPNAAPPVSLPLNTALAAAAAVAAGNPIKALTARAAKAGKKSPEEEEKERADSDSEPRPRSAAKKSRGKLRDFSV